MTWALWDRNVRIGKHETYVRSDDIYGTWEPGSAIVLLGDNDDDPPDMAWHGTITSAEQGIVYVNLDPTGPVRRCTTGDL